MNSFDGATAQPFDGVPPRFTVPSSVEVTESASAGAIYPEEVPERNVTVKCPDCGQLYEEPVRAFACGPSGCFMTLLCPICEVVQAVVPI